MPLMMKSAIRCIVVCSDILNPMYYPLTGRHASHWILTTSDMEIEMEHRKKDRRSYRKIPDFPFLTKNGVALEERRRYVDRRIRDTQAAYFIA